MKNIDKEERSYTFVGFFEVNPLCRMASKVKTAVETDTFSESIFPRMGIFIRASARSIQKSVNPAASVPIIKAQARVKSVS